MAETDFRVYKMKLQPGGAEAGTNPFEFCKSEEIIGVGWGGLAEDREYETVEDVHEAHIRKSERRAEEGKNTDEVLSDDRLKAPLRYILKEIEIGDFVWVNEENDFALCKITSDWRIDIDLSGQKAGEYSKRDIRHFRGVEWVDIPYEFVPGYVRRSFSVPFGTMKQMDVSSDAKQVMRSLHSHDDLSSERDLNRIEIAEKVEQAETSRIFSILGSEETEDIVLSYLQSEGWRIIKSSTSNTQAKIECEMRKEENSQSVPGYVQVKTGSAGLSPDSYDEYTEAGEMIFFVESGLDVSDRENMQTISPATIHEYIISNYNYVSNEPMLKLDFALSQ